MTTTLTDAERIDPTALNDHTVLREGDEFVSRAVATYAPSVIVEQASGAELWDTSGKRYIDFAGGIGVLNVGHTPPTVVAAIQEQATRLIHTCFSVAPYESYIEVCKRLVELMPGSGPAKAVLFNSGAEAVENAIKLARVATGRTKVIAFENAFHGRTMMAMTLTGKDRPYKAGFGPFAPDVFHARFPNMYRCGCDGHASDCEVSSGRDFDRLVEKLGATQIAAVIVEPVQGEGGFVVAPPEWLKHLRDVCTRSGIVFIADEVQTGFGRTGTMFAIEQFGILPDLMVLAKSMAAGLPLSAVVGRMGILDAPVPGGIGGTFGGNPISCAAALAVLDLFQHEDILERGKRLGYQVADRFQAIKDKYSIVGEVRGLGPMQAMELVLDRETKEPASALTAGIMHDCHDQGLLLIKAGQYDNVIRFLGPLIMSEEVLDQGFQILENVMRRHG